MGAWLDKLIHEATGRIHRAIFDPAHIEEAAHILLVDGGYEVCKLLDKYPQAKDVLDEDLDLPESLSARALHGTWWHELHQHERDDVRASLMYGLARPLVSEWVADATLPKGWAASTIDQIVATVCEEVSLYHLIVTQITEIVRLSRGVDPVAPVVAVRGPKGNGLTARQVTMTLRGEWTEDRLMEALGEDAETWAVRYMDVLRPLLKNR